MAIVTATITSITPSRAIEGASITFLGAVAPADDAQAAEWKSSIDGALSTAFDHGSSTFSIATLSVGEHTISFRGQDADGDWTDYDTETLVVVEADPAETIKDVLDDNWDEDVVEKPEIALKSTLKAYNLRSHDYIIVSIVASSRKYADMQHDYEDGAERVQIEISTCSSSDRLNILYNHVKSLLDDIRDGTSVWDVVTYTGGQDLSSKMHGEYEYVVDVEMKKYCEAI